MKYILLVLIFVLYGCSESTDEHGKDKPLSQEQIEMINDAKENLKKDAIELKVEAEAICSVFSPENLKDVIASKDPAFKAARLKTLLAEAYKKTKTNTIQEVLESMPLVEPDKRYQSYRTIVSTFLGEEYDCEDIKSYMLL